MKQEQREILRLLFSALHAGDSCGSSVEFAHQSEIPARYAKLKKKGWPWVQCGGGPFGWKPGCGTDDSDQALCLIRSFAKCSKFDPADVAQQLVGWLDSGPRDVGNTTMRTLSAIQSGTPWHRAGLNDWVKHPNAAANGALMRNGILPAIMFEQELDMLFRASTQHTIITHGHPLAVLTSAIQSFVIADELSGWEEGPAYDPNWLDNFCSDWTAYVEGEDDPFVGEWLDRTRNSFQEAGDAITEADWNPYSFNPFKTDFTGRDGFCLLTAQVGVWALLWSKIEDEPFPVPEGFPAEVFERRGPWTMAWPALVGHDTDTMCAVAAPMIAAAHGSVPASMTTRLQALTEFDELIPDAVEVGE